MINPCKRGGASPAFGTSRLASRLPSASSVAEARRRQEEAGEEARGQEARGEEDHRQEAGGGQEEVPGQEEVRGQEEVDVTSLGILCMGMGHFQSTLACASSADVQC